MKSCIALAALLAALAASPAAAQQPAVERAEAAPPTGPIAAAVDSAALAASPELEQALDQLTVALNGLVSRIANDPELRLAAAQAAQGMVGVAQIVVEEQSEVLQDVLRAAAEEIAALPGREPARRDPR
jgi:hypothetical protein